LDNVAFVSKIGPQSSKGIVFAAKIENPKNSNKWFDVAIKIFFNYYDSHTKTTKPYNGQDLTFMFDLPMHKNLIHGLCHFKDTVDAYWLWALPGVDRNGIQVDRIIKPDDTMDMQFLAMPLYSEPLSSLLLTPLKTPQIIKHALNIANALDFLHTEANCCHCAVKSSHILLNKRDDDLVLVGLDMCTKMGLPLLTNGALAPSSPQKPTSLSLSSSSSHLPPHLPPDDLQRVSPPIDVFSFGVVLYEMLSGQNLFIPIGNSCRWESVKLKALPFIKSGAGQYNPGDIPFDPSCPEKLKDIVRGSLNLNARKRMELGDIVRILKELIF